MADRNNPDDELELPIICDSQPQKKSSYSDKNVQPSCVCCTKRCIVAVLVCFGFFITFGMRNNVAHVFNHVDFTTKTMALIFTSYYWSYLLTQFPGGILASIYPANRIFGISIICSSFLNLLLPESFTWHPIPVIIIRILQGVFEGLSLPAFYGMLRFWAPPSENSRFVTFILGSQYAGLLVPFSRILTEKYHWNISFYVYGATGIIWFLFWNWLVFEKPASHSTISLEEKTYIEQSLDGSESKITFKTIPWRNIFTSMPVYAIIVANFCHSWTFSSFFYFQTIYLHDLFNVDFYYAKYATPTTLSFLVLVLIVPIGGVIADFIRNKNILSTTNVRKVFSCGGLAVQGLLLLMLAYFVKSATAALVILNIGFAFGGLALAGFNVNHLDIAPRYASTLMGLSQGIGSTAGSLSPIMIQVILRNNYDHTVNWAYLFLIGTCVHLIGIIFYAIFASGELQPWSEPKSSTSSEPEKLADDKTQLTSTEPTNYGTE